MEITFIDDDDGANVVNKFSLQLTWLNFKLWTNNYLNYY